MFFILILSIVTHWQFNLISVNCYSTHMTQNIFIRNLILKKYYYNDFFFDHSARKGMFKRFETRGFGMATAGLAASDIYLLTHSSQDSQRGW